MTVVFRGAIPRSLPSFTVSACAHACVLAWVVFGGGGPMRPRPLSIYDQEIRPHEKKIVWYSLQEKLPEIGPSRTELDTRPARARVKAPQTMVAGLRDDAHPATLIWAPEPEAAAVKTAPLPNVVAVAPPKVVRPFVAPPVKPLPAPEVASLTEAPRVTAADVRAALPLPEVNLGGPRRAFTPPPNVRMQKQAVIQLPEGPRPDMVVEPDALPFPDAGPRPQPKTFIAPAAKSRAVAALDLPAAPEVASLTSPKAGLEKVPRSFLARNLPARPEIAPAISAEPPVAPSGPRQAAEASFAIVGLNPARTMEVPAPPASRTAGFSAGTQPREEGSTGANRIALVNVPGLVVQGGAKDTRPTMATTFSPTSKENLLAAARVATGGPRPTGDPYTSRTPVPDPRFAGRVVYTMAIQMPNVTSFSGSWLVWFAERDPQAGGAPRQMRPPEVVRKVDPKYIAAAAADRVEGTVRLFGVIGKDGHVGGIALVRQLDDRLDRSAQEALSKWEFTPALRNGTPVEVDALFEIPFHLAPRLNQ
jgi:TonB family protein